MSNVGQQRNATASTNAQNVSNTSSVEEKGKGKSVKPDEDTMEDDDDDDDDDDDEEEEGEDEEDEEENMEEEFNEIDPGVILPTTRRTRGVKVDYTSVEALKKAGLEPGEGEEMDEEEEFDESKAATA